MCSASRSSRPAAPSQHPSPFGELVSSSQRESYDHLIVLFDRYKQASVVSQSVQSEHGVLGRIVRSTNNNVAAVANVDADLRTAARELLAARAVYLSQFTRHHAAANRR